MEEMSGSYLEHTDLAYLAYVLKSLQDAEKNIGLIFGRCRALKLIEDEQHEQFLKDLELEEENLRNVKKSDDDLTVKEDDSQVLLHIKGISIGKTPRKDGRIMGRWKYDENKPPKYYYGRTAEEIEHLIATDVKNGIPPQLKAKRRTPKGQFNRDTKLRDYFDAWVVKYQRSKKKISLKTLKCVTDSLAYISQKFGDYRLKDIEGASFEIEDLLISMKATRARELALMYCNKALKRLVPSVLKCNPCDWVSIPGHKGQKIDALTVSEQKRIEENIHLVLRGSIIPFLIKTGLRIGEALALSPEDFFEFRGRHFATISKTILSGLSRKDADEYIAHHDDVEIVEANGRFMIVQHYPKTEAGKRLAYIPEAVMPKLEGRWVFPYSYGQCADDLEKLSKLLNIDLRLNRLRHTYATRLEEKKMPAKVKAAFMGHDDENVTQRVYTDIQIEYLETFCPIVDDAFQTEE